MDIRYPKRKADGREYKNYNKLLTDIRKNAHGWWLFGISRYWHGVGPHRDLIVSCSS